MKTIIRNGRVNTAVDDYKANILIEVEVVSVIGANLWMAVLRPSSSYIGPELLIIRNEVS